MAIETLYLKNQVIMPVLKNIKLFSDSAVNLLLGTCAQESAMGSYEKQMNGPALGIYQMEPATFNDIWKNFLVYKMGLSKAIQDLLSDNEKANPLNALQKNIFYATAMARVHYFRVKAPLPLADDIEGLAAYYKRYYNTDRGKATEQQFIDNWDIYVQPYI